MTSEACDETPLDGIERGSLFCGLLPGRYLAEINSKIPSKPSASASSGQRCRSLRICGTGDERPQTQLLGTRPVPLAG